MKRVKEYSKQKNQNWQNISILRNMEILMGLKELKEEDPGNIKFQSYYKIINLYIFNE